MAGAEWGTADRQYGIPGIDNVSGEAQQSGIKAYERERDSGGDQAARTQAAITASSGKTGSDPLNDWMAKNGIFEPGFAPYDVRTYSWLKGGAQNPYGDTGLDNWGGNDRKIIELARNGGDWLSLYNQYGFGGSKYGGNGSMAGMGDVQKSDQVLNQHDNPTVGSTGGDASKASGLARLMQLWGDPQAAANEVLRNMGMGEFNTGPLASFMRSKAGMLKPAYYLAKGGESSGMNNPNDYLDFAKNFLQSAGGNLGDAKGLAQNALGMGGPGGQSAGWKELLSGVNPDTGQPWITDDERANWVKSMYQIQNMGSFNPLRDYAARSLERLPSQFSQDYGAGRTSDQEDFMGYLRSKLPGMIGW